MAIDPIWGTITSTLGKGIEGFAQSGERHKNEQQRIEEERRRLAEQQRQFNANLNEQQRQSNATAGNRQFDSNVNATTSYGDRAQSVNRELELLPLRDRAAAMMGTMMGQGVSPTAPRSLAGGGTDALRGGAAPQMPYDLEALQKAAGSYTPGQGGMTGEVQRELLEKYRDVPQAPGIAPVDNTQQEAAAQHEKDLMAVDAVLKRMKTPSGEIQKILDDYRNNPEKISQFLEWAQSMEGR